MLVRVIVAAVPLLLGAGQEGSKESSERSKERQGSGAMGDSVPGHGHSAGALGNSSDTTGAKGKGGAGSRSGTAGRKSEVGAGEASDTTSGARSGRWDRAGGGTGSGTMDPSGASTATDAGAKAPGQKKTKKAPARAKPKPKAAPKAQEGAPKAEEGKGAEAK